MESLQYLTVSPSPHGFMIVLAIQDHPCVSSVLSNTTWVSQPEVITIIFFLLVLGDEKSMSEIGANVTLCMPGGI